MSRTWLALGALVLFGLAATACGPTTPACGPGTCFGCCDAAGVCQPGTTPSACGGNGAACTACFAGQSCSVGTCVNPQQCVPQTCSGLGLNCGQVEDGCGGVLDCGTCSNAGESCGGSGTANVCGPGTCSPKSCADLGYGCGSASDGCGALLDCGTCPSGFCGGGGPHQCGACQPASCAGLGKNCGMVQDGCGGTLDCGGSCPSGKTCGGGGVPNVCGSGVCTPHSCSELQKNCGTVDDGCGTMLSCGTCQGWLTCGGGGTANVCGATCSPACPGGFSCDSSGVCSGGSLSGLVLNEVGYPVSGVVQVNGAAPTKTGTFCQSYPTGYDLVDVTFTESTKGYSATAYVDCSANWAFNVTLPPGTYDVHVSRGSYATSAGTNVMDVSYLAQSGLVVGAPVNGLVYNEVGYAVSGVVQVNGASPTKTGTFCQSYPTGYDLVDVSFSDSSKGYYATAYVDCSANWAFNVTLPPGTYDVHVSRGSYATSAGTNVMDVSYLAQSGLVVGAPVNGLVYNEVGYAVSGVVQVNGAAPTKTGTFCQSYPTGYDLVDVTFTESSKGYSATAYVDCSANWAFNVTLPPGTYDVHVSRGSYATSAGTNVMDVSYLAQSGLAVSAPVNGLVYNEVGYAVSGVVQVNGAAPTKTGTFCQSYPTGYDLVDVSFSDSSRGYYATAYVDCSANWAFNVTLPPGTYDVHVSRGSYATSAGTNVMDVSYLAQSGLVVGAPVNGLVYNEVGYAVSGVVQVNGAAPTKTGTFCQSYPTGYDLVDVTFTESSKGYSATAYVDCSANWAFNVTLPPGTYDVHVSRGSYATSAGTNVMDVSYVAQTGLAVSGPVNGLVYNEIGYAVSGVVQVNGAAPTKTGTFCSSYPTGYDLVDVSFSDSTKGYYATAYVDCSANWAFNITLPSGVYEVRLSRGSYATSAGTNVMDVSYQVIDRLAVP